MRITLFSTRPYDRESFESVNRRHFTAGKPLSTRVEASKTD